MKFLHVLPIFLVGGTLVACGGSRPAPAVESNTPKAPAEKATPATTPATTPVNAPAVQTPAKAPELTPVPVTVPVEESKVFMDNAVDRYSYALGVDFGRAVSNINVPVKLEVLINAMRDVIDPSREVLMTDSVTEAALQDLLTQMQTQKDIDDAAAARKAMGDQASFLAQNIKDPRVWVTKKGVQYLILKEGTGIKPKPSDKVQVHYVGTLLDGTEFDNSVKRGVPLEFPVTAVIEGWQDLLLEMKVGEKVKAWIPSALAYGEAGAPPSIPPNSLLVLEVELLQVFANVPSGSSMVPAKGSIITP